MMELWATGFNAWGQLRFADVPGSETLPRDLHSFKCLLRDEYIEVLAATLSATCVRTSSGTKVAGHDSNFEVLFPSPTSTRDPSTTAIAGNEKIVLLTNGVTTQYDSIQACRQAKSQTLLHDAGEIKQIVASETTFTALSTKGEILTWGDGRYETCLGREITDESPASLPSIIPDLLDLPTGPITKISSGGYVMAALTAGKDLYVWGGRPGQEKVLEELGGAPMPVDVQGHDLVDVAVGFNHVIVLTEDGGVFVAGAGGNGQLGLGEVVERRDWTRVDLPLMPGQRVMSVCAGYKNSFLVISQANANGGR